MISKTPIYIDLDRRREITFNLNTEILLRSLLAPGESSMWETIGVKTVDGPNGEVKEERILDVNRANLRAYLWAALQRDAQAHNEKLTLDDVGALITRGKQVSTAVTAIGKALNAYYGDDPAGETQAPAAE